MSPEMHELIERVRQSLERLEELRTETTKIATETRRIVRKLETLEPRQPAQDVKKRGSDPLAGRASKAGVDRA